MENLSDDHTVVSKKYLNPHFAYLEAAAMWPVRKFQTKYVNYTIMFCLLISLSCQIMLLIMEHAYLIQSTSEPLEIIAYIGTSCLRVEALGKLLYMMIIRNKLRNILHSLENCIKLSIRGTSHEDKKNYANSIMKTWSFKAKSMATFWIGLCLFGGIQWALTPFGINGETTVTIDEYHILEQSNLTDNLTEWSPRTETVLIRVHTLRGWFPFNATLSPAYEITFLIQGIGIICTAFAAGAFDQFYFAILLILCGQFECLKKSLRNITLYNQTFTLRGIATRKPSVITEILSASNTEICARDPSFFDEDELNYLENKQKIVIVDSDVSIKSILSTRSMIISRKRMENELNDCIRHHQSIISAVRNLNSTYSHMIFLQCHKSLLALCLVAFQVTMVNGEALQLYSLVEYVILLVIQLFMYCWCASELTLKALSVKDAVYSSDWTDASKSYKTSMKIMIHNCQTPILLTGGAFYRLTMGLFVELLRLSFSTYTVLREVHENK